MESQGFKIPCLIFGKRTSLMNDEFEKPINDFCPRNILSRFLINVLFLLKRPIINGETTMSPIENTTSNILFLRIFSGVTNVFKSKM